MDIALNGGDFDLDNRGMPYLLSGLAELMQRVSIALKVKKGCFCLDQNLGSELYLLDKGSSLLQKRAEMLIREAIANVPQIEVSNIEASFLDDERLRIKLNVDFAGDKGSLEVVV
ncbi:MAG: hypothetical protein ACI4I4_04480 [Acutalibacteraceae bacterium]